MAYAKFWAAAIMAIVAYLRSAYNIDIGVDETTATAIVSGVTALLVYLVPNVPAPATKPASDAMDQVQ